MAKIGPQICTPDAMNTFNVALMSLWPEFWFDLIYHVSSLSTRAINAGKSALNEDQARCEVLVIKRKPGGNPASSQIPMTRRRSSLPNGEGVDPPSCSVSETTPFNLCGSVACARWQPDTSKWWTYSPNKHVAHVQGAFVKAGCAIAGATGSVWWYSHVHLKPRALSCTHLMTHHRSDAAIGSHFPALCLLHWGSRCLLEQNKDGVIVCDQSSAGAALSSALNSNIFDIGKQMWPLNLGGGTFEGSRDKSVPWPGARWHFHGYTDVLITVRTLALQKCR